VSVITKNGFSAHRSLQTQIFANHSHRWHRISRLGVARTFQRNNLFLNLSVSENLQLAAQVRRGNPLNFYTPTRLDAAVIAQAQQLLTQVHLNGTDDRPVRTLSYGEQRQLEIAVALAGEPMLLLLDEPTSGMSPAETERMIALISALPRSIALLMIEHDMNVVFSVADRITVLSFGEVLASGTVAEIRNNDRVREIYLGTALWCWSSKNVNADYDDSHVLHGISLTVNEGELVSLLGRNGAGKTTTILTIMGYLRPRPGRIAYAGREISTLPTHEVSPKQQK
jgi:ABC-type branched-subunit amino acid transport system ATPase component